MGYEFQSQIKIAEKNANPSSHSGFRSYPQAKQTEMLL